MRLRNIDGTVKSPDAALRGIPRHCDVPLSTPHSSGFARLACELFTAPSENPTFYGAVNLEASFAHQGGDPYNHPWSAGTKNRPSSASKVNPYLMAVAIDQR